MAATVLSILAAAVANPSAAQTPPVVGMPGCSDDVSIRAARETIAFESRGQTIRAHLYTPRGEPNGKGLVLLHGGTGFEMNAILFDAHAIQLASRGYWVILPAYFDAARPDDRRRTVTARAWRRVAQDAARLLSGKPDVDENGVALWGYSRGGGVAVGAGLEKDAPVAAVIGVATGGEPDDDPRLDVPVLLLHARTDEAVPSRATRGLARALEDAGVPVSIDMLDFDGHRYDLPTWCQTFARTRAFLEGLESRGDGPA